MALNMSAFTAVKEKPKTKLNLSAFGIKTPAIIQPQKTDKASLLNNEMIKSGQATNAPITSIPQREPQENIFKKTLNNILNLPKKLQDNLGTQFKKEQERMPKPSQAPYKSTVQFLPEAIKETLQGAVGYTPISPEEPFAKLPLWRKVTDVVAEVNPAIMQVGGETLNSLYGFFASAVDPTKEKFKVPIKLPYTTGIAPSLLGTYRDARKIGLSPLWATVLTTSRAAGEVLIAEGIGKGLGKIPVESPKITTLNRNDLMNLTRGEEFAGKVDPAKVDAFHKLSQEGVNWNKALKDTGTIDVKTGKAKTLGEAVEEQASILKQNERGFAKIPGNKDLNTSAFDNISKSDSLIQEIKKYKSEEEFINDSLFHGSSEGKFAGTFKKSNYDGITVWTAESPQIAQNYIPETGSSEIFGKPNEYQLSENIKPQDYSKEIENLVGAKFSDVKYNSKNEGSHSLQSWVNGNPITHQQVIDKLTELGYEVPEKYGSYEIKLHNNKIVPSNFKMESTLHIFTGKNKLKLYDMRGKGDLQNPDYREINNFKVIEKNGYDGVIIDDYTQSKSMGNYGHKSIGLFNSGYLKLKEHKITATNFDNFFNNPKKSTPELTDIWNKAQSLQPKTLEEVFKSDPLIQEAKKYKSAEEFMKAQEPIYKGLNIGENPLGSFSTDINHATRRGINISRNGGGKVQTVERYFEPNTKFAPFNEYHKKFAELKTEKATDEYFKSLGYDGVDFRKSPTMKGEIEKEVRIWNQDKILTKSQLTDIWNKAQKTKEIIPAELNKLTKTEADFRNFDDVNNYLEKHGEELSDTELAKYSEIADKLYNQEEENAYKQTFGDITDMPEFFGEDESQYNNFKEVAKKLYGSMKKAVANVEDLGSMERIAKRKGLENKLQNTVYSQNVSADEKLQTFLGAIKKEYGYGMEKKVAAKQLPAKFKEVAVKKENLDKRIKEFILKQAPQLDTDFIYSAKKVFRRTLDAKALTKYGEEGTAIYNKIKLAEKWAIKKEAELITSLDKVFDNFLEKEFNDFGDYIEGKKDVPEIALDAVLRWEKTAEEIAQLSVKEGVMIKNSEGIEHLFKPIKNYYPAFIKEEKLAEIFQDQIKYKAFLDKMAELNNITVAQAHKIIQKMVNNKTDFYGHLERAREARLPEEFYERDPRNILGQYIHGALKRLGIVKEFGAKDQTLNKLIQTALDKGEDFEEIQMLADRALGREKFNKDLVKVSSFARMYNNITKLSLAAITNMGDLTKSFIRTNFISGVKGLVKSFTKEGKILSRKSGVLDTQLIDYAKEQGLGNKFYKYTGFKWTEQLVRRHMALASRNYIKLLYGKLVKNPNSSFTRRRLEQFDLNPDILLQKGLTENDLIDGAIKAIGDAQPVSAVDMPYSWQSPIGKVITQYKQFSYKQWQFAKEFIFKEAKQGNLKPLLMFIMVGLALGEAVGDIKAFVRGRERPEKLANRMIDNLMTIGGVGLATDFLSNLQYGSMGGGFLKFVVGPTLSDIDAWMTAIQGDINTIMTDNKFIAFRKVNKGERQVKSLKKVMYSLPFIGPALANGVFPTRSTYNARTIPIAEEILQMMEETQPKIIKPNIVKPKINKPNILKPNK